MKAVILAAGQGTRLRPVTLTMPKPLVPVANQPLIAYAIDMLKHAGLTEIGIVVNDLDSPIVTQLNSGAELGVTLSYIVQREQKGLAHAIGLCEEFVAGQPFCVFLGDNIFQDKMQDWLREFATTSAQVSLALGEVGDPKRFGIATVQDGQIVEVIEKPQVPKSNLAIAGVYLFKPTIFEGIRSISPSQRGEYEITDAIQWMITHGHEVGYYTVTGWWIDAGKPDSIIQANQLVMGDLPYTPAPEDKSMIMGKCDISHRVLIGENSRIEDSVIRGPVIIGKNVIIKNAFIGPYTAIGDACVVENAEIEASIVMKGCTLQNISGRIDSSLLADNSQVTSASSRLPASHRFILAENSYVQL